MILKISIKLEVIEFNVDRDTGVLLMKDLLLPDDDISSNNCFRFIFKIIFNKSSLLFFSTIRDSSKTHLIFLSNNNPLSTFAH